MGFLADKTVFSPLTKEILEESISFSCGNEDLDGFFVSIRLMPYCVPR